MHYVEGPWKKRFFPNLAKKPPGRKMMQLELKVFLSLASPTREPFSSCFPILNFIVLEVDILVE
jgi:hypothetical protein